MSFHFNTGVCPTKADELHASYVDAYLAAENLRQIERELDDHLREFDALVPLMDNVNEAIENLRLYGKDAIPTLNIDKGLESLMKIPEQLITVEKALEALDEQKKGFFQRLIEWIKTFFEKTKRFIENLLAMHNGDAVKIEASHEMINIDDEVSMVPHPRAIRLIELHRDAMKVYDEALSKFMVAGEAQELQDLFEQTDAKMKNLGREYETVVDYEEGTGVLSLKSNDYLREGTTVKKAGYADHEVARKLAKAWKDIVPKRTFDHWGVDKYYRKMDQDIKNIQNAPRLLTAGDEEPNESTKRRALRDTDEARRFRIQMLKLEMSLVRLMTIIQSQIAHSLHVLAKHCQ